MYCAFLCILCPVTLQIFIYEVVHIFLQRIYDKVELVTLIDKLTNCTKLLTECELVFVEGISELISLVNFSLLLVLDIDQGTVFLCTLSS